MKPINITLLTKVQDIKDAIASIAKRGATLEKDIHITAVSIVAHAEAHGDITLANRLIEAVPNIGRKEALREWFQTFGKFTYSAETKALKYDKAKKTKTAEAISLPFWELKAENEQKPFNLEEAFVAFVYKAQKRAEKKDKRDKIPHNLLKQLQLLVVDDKKQTAA